MCTHANIIIYTHVSFILCSRGLGVSRKFEMPSFSCSDPALGNLVRFVRDFTVGLVLQYLGFRVTSVLGSIGFHMFL